MRKKPFQKIKVKGENASYQHVLLFHKVFYIKYKFCHFSLISDLYIMKAFTWSQRPYKCSLNDVLCQRKKKNSTNISIMNSPVT